MSADNMYQTKATEELVETGRWLFRCIYVTDCFSASDIINLGLIWQELENRKVKIHCVREVTFEIEDE